MLLLKIHKLRLRYRPPLMINSNKEIVLFIPVVDAAIVVMLMLMRQWMQIDHVIDQNALKNQDPEMTEHQHWCNVVC